jgi:hypothetical protein
LDIQSLRFGIGGLAPDATNSSPTGGCRLCRERCESTAATAMDERRAPRLHLNRELTGEVTVYRPLSVSDLSPEGARVETSDSLRVGSVRAFRFNLGDQTVVLKGRITHASVRTLAGAGVVYTSGVEFLDVPPASRDALEHFLARAGAPRIDVID